MKTEHEIDGISVRVCELIGGPGDITFGHPWLLHAIAPACGKRPRFMCIQRIKANGKDTLVEGAEG